MKRLIVLVMILVLIFTFTACSGSTGGNVNSITASPQNNITATGQTTTTSPENTVDYDGDDINNNTNSAATSYIAFQGNSITLTGKGATVDGNTVTITSAGSYSISGTLDNGQIIVDTADQETAKLILNGVNITCIDGPPIYVVNSEKTVITLADGSSNTATDGETYVLVDTTTGEPNAAIFSKSDLTINGSGSLTVNANYNNGIQSKDDLKITGGTITISATNDGVKGRDSIAIKDGVININAGGDGLQATNDENAEKGFVSIEGGTLNITAGEDGIQAETNLMFSGGAVTISSGGGSSNSSSNIATAGNTWGMWGAQKSPATTSSTPSAKGLKAGVNLTITGGTITIDSSDDSIHSNNSLTIDGGNITITSGDDGIHSDTTLAINGGDITIDKSYEGIESAAITVNNGTIHIVASDDGFNAAGGVDASSLDGRPGQNNFNMSGNDSLNINGGYIYIGADGDGMDVNGPVTMTGGTVIIDGPTRNDNGALDYIGSFKMTGGYLIAAGSSGMAQTPSTSSTQYSLMVNFSNTLAAGTLFHIETTSGEDILTFKPAKAYQSVVFCSTDLKNGSTYSIYTGGSDTGTLTDGLYSDGEYTGGTQLTSLTINGIVTTYGSSGGMNPGDKGGGGFPDGRRR
jgi:hypothetical protein